MTENIRVVCLLDRSWDVATKSYLGTPANGTLIDVSVKGDSEEFAPVGIVMLDDDSFECVPMEFITKEVI